MKLTDDIFVYPERGMLDANTYVFRGQETLVIDPGSLQTIQDKLREMATDGIKPEEITAITITHLHPDHYWAANTLKQATGAEIVIPRMQEAYIQPFIDDAARLFGMQGLEFTPSRFIEDDKLEIGGRTLELVHSPGHSPESFCYYDPEIKFLACGDVIFDHNIGRTDLPRGNASELKASINALSDMDIEYLLPGHMDVLRGRESIKGNFVFVRTSIFSWM
jgi:hydroxyacylglutathione hydrolase